ncbi:hypothetical protein K4F52_000719 [Lecanicillium sp. MT-2017a]|nr:hypothetical protein K4F52_000719 [Lecanicillium sp. MT-2017a]
MASTDNDVGKICWLDVPVYDVERAKKFYTEVLDWDCNVGAFPDPGPGAHSMHFFKNAAGVNGAFSHMKEGLLVTNHNKTSREALSLAPTFNVENCQETLDKAIKAGGELH